MRQCVVLGMHETMPIGSRVIVATLILTASAWAAEPFTRLLTAEELAAAGLDRLTPAERARLDELVRKHESGELARARAEAVAAQAAAEKAAQAAAAAEAKAADGETRGDGFFTKARKVILRPGAEVAYEAEDTELVGTFSGFEPGTVFTFANGQRWRVEDGSYVTGPNPKVRKVRVEPGLLGAFFLRFEGVSVRAKARIVGR